MRAQVEIHLEPLTATAMESICTLLHISCSSIRRKHGDSHYFLMGNYRNWLAASSQCRAFGMTLAAAKDVTDVRVFHDMLTEFSSSTTVAAWLDGTKMMTIDNWYCTSYGYACPRIPWASGEPSNSASESCVCLWPGQTDGVNDCACSDLLPFICEFNPH